MMRSRSLRALFIVTIGGGVLFGIAYVLLRRVPSLQEQLPPNSAPLSISLSQPLSGERYPVSGGVPVFAQAIGQSPLTRLELWADGELSKSSNADLNGLHMLTGDWRWTPGMLGEHTLMTRIYDMDGNTADSNVVHLIAEPDPGMLLIVDTVEGDTFETLGEAYGADPAALAAANPDLDPAGRLQPGTDVFVPIPPPPPPSQSSHGQAPQTLPPADLARTPPGASLAFWFQKQLPGDVSSQALPAAPELQANAEGCAARLVFSDASDEESGFFVYRLSPQEGSFTRIATLGQHSGTGPVQYNDLNLRGTYQYYVAAYNTSGEAPSNIVQLAAEDPSCAPSAQVYRLDELFPSAAEGLDLAYLYVTPDGEHWGRVPVDPQSFFDSPAADINMNVIAGLAAPGAGSMETLSGEGWGWDGGTLVFLGTFSMDIAAQTTQPNPATSLLPPPTLEARGTVIVDIHEYNWTQEKSFGSVGEMAGAIFRWSDDASMSHGRWQVSAIPFSDELSLNPPGLLLTGLAPKPSAPGTEKEFPIDLSPLVQPQTMEVQKAQQPAGVQTTGLGVLPPFASPFSAAPQASGEPVLGTPFLTIPAGGFSNRNVVVAGTDPESLALSGVNTYYVRVLPMNGNQIAGKTTNTVVVHFSPSEGVQIVIPPEKYVKIPYQVEILDYAPLQLPDSSYEYCIEIVSVDHNKLGPVSPWNLMQPGQKLCPEKKESKSKLEQTLSDLGDLIEAGVNFVSDLYDKIDAFIKEWVDKLNPLCIGAKFAADAADTGQDTVADICKTVASMSVDAVKAMYGVPPSLPDFDQLTGMGKDYLVELAADEMESAGVPCPDECKQLIRDGIDLTLEQVKASLDNPACSSEAEKNNYEPICPPDGIVVKPDSRGLYAPPILTVRLTRPDLPDPSPLQGQELIACGLQVTDEYQNDFWVGKKLTLDSPGYVPDIGWEGTPLAGRLFVDTVMPVPLIAPGESIVIPLPLAYPKGAYTPAGIALSHYYSGESDNNPWLPGHAAIWKQHVGAPDVWTWLFDWLARYHGAQVTFTASSCGSKDQMDVGPLSVPRFAGWYGSP